MLIIQSLVGFKPTIFVYLVMLLFYQRMQCWSSGMSSNILFLITGSKRIIWEVGRQCQGLQKKVKSLRMISSCHEKVDDCLDILNSMFFKSIFLRSEKFQMYRSSPEGSGGPFLSAPTWSLTERGRCLLAFKRINVLPQTVSFRERT